MIEKAAEETRGELTSNFKSLNNQPSEENVSPNFLYEYRKTG